MKSAGDVSIGVLGYTFGLVLGALVYIKAGNRYPGIDSGRPSESPWVCWICQSVGPKLELDEFYVVYCVERMSMKKRMSFDDLCVA